MSVSLWGDAFLELVRNVPAAGAVILTVVIFARLLRGLIADHRKDVAVCHQNQTRSTDAQIKLATSQQAMASALQQLLAAQMRVPASALEETPAPRPPPDPPAPI